MTKIETFYCVNVTFHLHLSESKYQQDVLKIKNQKYQLVYSQTVNVSDVL